MVEGKKRQFSIYQIHLGDLCVGHREARPAQKEVLMERALILYIVGEL